MANLKTCDCCGNNGAKSVQVSIVVVGDVIEGQPTGTSHGADLCDDCRIDECGKMHAKALDQHQRHIVIHRELIALRANMGELVNAKNDAVAERDSRKEGTSEYKVAAKRVEERMTAIANNEARQKELLAAAAE